MSSTVDLHMHSTASDGSNAPEEFPEIIHGSGIEIFALTDHDTTAGAVQLLKMAQQETGNTGSAETNASDTSGYYAGKAVDLTSAGGTVRFIPGIELSSKTETGLCHLLGYCYEPDSSALGYAVAQVEKKRMAKMDIRIYNLEKNDGIRLTNEEKDWIYSQESPGRPHIAQILMKRGLASSVTDAFDKYLNSAHSPVPADIARIDAKLALDSIHNAGGISSWAHPLGGERDVRLTKEQFERELDILTGLGLQGLECYYSRYSKDEIDFLLDEAHRHGLMISGGSDYHGSNKNISPGLLNTDNVRIVPEQLSILNEIL